MKLGSKAKVFILIITRGSAIGKVEVHQSWGEAGSCQI